jgi:hypothetical protein
MKCRPYIWLLGLWASLADAATWEFTSPIEPGDATMRLHIDPSVKEVRGIILALDNLLEKPLLEDRMVRRMAREEGLAIAWIAAASNGSRPFDKGVDPKNGELERLDAALAHLARQSGFAELERAPWIPIGHSAGVPFAVGLAWWRPERVACVVSVKSHLPGRPSDSPGDWTRIPLLIIKGQFEEWARPGEACDREASWKNQREWARGQRAADARNLIGFVLDAGGGHFESDERLTKVITDYIRATARLRIDGHGQLTPVEALQGALSDTASSAEADAPVIAPAAAFDRTRDPGFWFPNPDIAKQCRTHRIGQFRRAPQFTTFAGPDGPRPLSPRGIVEIPWKPVSPENRLELTGAAFPTIPEGILGAGGKVGTTPRPTSVQLVRGPFEQVSPGVFQLALDGTGFGWRSRDAWFVASTPGDGRVRAAVQAGILHVPYPAADGRTQSLRVELPESVGLFTDRVPLRAESESRQPVHFAVVSGPAVVENGFLRLTRRPARSPWPAEVRVVAIQLGGADWQATEPAYRTLRVEAPPQKPFAHPGLLDSRAELDDVRARIQRGEEPWASRWKAMLASDELAPRHRPSPRAHVVRDLGGRWEGTFELGLDSRRAYSHALAWALGGDPEHARRAAEFIDAWSEKLESITGHDARLLAGITGHKFCNAAELLRHTGAAWPEDRQKRFRDMMLRVFVPICRDFYPSANGNWDASMILTLMSIGVHLDDHELFQRAVEYALHGEGNGAIPRYILPDGVCQESARDQQHTQLGLGFLADACETAWNQGVDLYAAFDNRLATGFEFTAAYNLGEDPPPEVKISPDGRGRFRPIYARVVSHYQGRLGHPVPKSAEASTRTPSDALQWDHLPWQSLMEAKPAKR